MSDFLFCVVLNGPLLRDNWNDAETALCRECKRNNTDCPANVSHCLQTNKQLPFSVSWQDLKDLFREAGPFFNTHPPHPSHATKTQEQSSEPTSQSHQPVVPEGLEPLHSARMMRLYGPLTCSTIMSGMDDGLKLEKTGLLRVRIGICQVCLIVIVSRKKLYNDVFEKKGLDK